MKITWRESITDGNYYANVPHKRGTQRDTRDWYSRGTNVMIVPIYFQGKQFLVQAGGQTLGAYASLYKAKVHANQFIRTMQGQHEMCELASGKLQY